MSFTQPLLSALTNFLSAGGYPALTALTFLDSTVIPLPNETFMPFVGYLISTGRFEILPVIIIVTLGAIFGSLTSYAIGYYGADPFVHKFGKYFRIKEANLKKTHDFFEKYGERVILISRFIPVVRQFSSIPAGAAKMKLWKFVLFTGIGSLLWNSAILSLGYTVGINSKRFQQYTAYIDRAIIVIFAWGVVFLLYKQLRKRKSV